MRRRTRLLRALAAVLLAAPAAAGAQSWRTFDVSRQLHDSTPLLVRLEYEAGSLAVHAAQTPVLYSARLRYDAALTQPRYDYTPATRTLRLGLQKRAEGLSLERGEAGELRVELSRVAPLDLELRLGAVEADLDFSGLRIDHLKVESDASEATVRFDTPNPERMRALAFQVGAASLKVARLANANADHIRVQAGVGSVDLDFSGRWTQDIDLTLEMALGSARLRVPRDVGVQLEAKRFLASYERAGLVKRGDVWVSENWDTAPFKLRIRSQMTIGKFELERSE
jgi:hypothetical protein